MIGFRVKRASPRCLGARREWRTRKLRARFGGEALEHEPEQGLLRAAERFRRIKAHGHLGTLVTALGAGATA